MHRKTSRLTSTLLLLFACSPKQDGDAESASTGEGVETEPLGHSSAPTVPTTTGEDPAEPTTSPTITGATEGTTTLAETSSFGSSGAPEAPACVLMCNLAVVCQESPDLASCLGPCDDELAAATPACAAASETLLTCLAGMSCEQLALALDGQLGHPCGFEQSDRNTACGGGPDTCDTGGGGDVAGTECTIETQCAGDPLRRMECDTETCLCFENDEQIGSCPADSACMDLSQLGAKALSCCGFPDVGPDVGP